MHEFFTLRSLMVVIFARQLNRSSSVELSGLFGLLAGVNDRSLNLNFKNE